MDAPGGTVSSAMSHVGAVIGRPKASLVQMVDFPVSGENVCEADKRGLGVARRKP